MRRRNRLHYHKRRNKKFDLNARKVCLLSSFVFLVGGVFWAIQSTLIFSKISFMDREEDILIQERYSLEEKLFKFDSLNNAVLMSQNMGFTDEIDLVYLSDEKPVAKLP